METSLILIKGHLGEELTFDENDRPVFFFTGAFSPPHKGHWLQIENILNRFEGSRVIINQLGGRHMFPENIVKIVFRVYIDKSIFKERIVLLYRCDPFTAIKTGLINDATHFIMLRGFEPHKHFDLGKCKTYQLTQNISDILIKRRVKTILFMVNRNPKNTSIKFSSTQFSSLLSSRNPKDRRLLYQFIPDHIRDKYLIIRTLLCPSRHCNPKLGSFVEVKDSIYSFS